MSLYWILALTVTLLHCLSALPTNRGKRSTVLYDEIETRINYLKALSCKENDSTFYSPSGSEECINEALDCSILELEKLKAECIEDNQKVHVMTVNFTRDSIKDMLKERNFSAQGNHYNCFCGKEKLEEKPYKEYLDNILILLQRLNSKNDISA